MYVYADENHWLILVVPCVCLGPWKLYKFNTSQSLHCFVIQTSFLPDHLNINFLLLISLNTQFPCQLWVAMTARFTYTRRSMVSSPEYRVFLVTRTGSEDWISHMMVKHIKIKVQLQYYLRAMKFLAIVMPPVDQGTGFTQDVGKYSNELCPALNCLGGHVQNLLRVKKRTLAEICHSLQGVGG